MKLAAVFQSGRTLCMCAAALASVATFTGCGDASDPDPVTIEKLKAPGDLKIRDDGDGAVTLMWAGANNEEDFDGYNVYGMKGSAADLGVTEGKSLELIGSDGEAIEASKAILAKFNYGPATGLASAAPAKDADDKDISALPIHTVDEDDPLLPTCKHDGTSAEGTRGKCVNTIPDNFGTAVEDGADGAKVALTGTIEYGVSGLTPGESYCFLVLSSMDKGKKVSAQSSNVACVRPRFKATATINAPNGASEHQLLNLKSWVTSCTTTCSAPSSTDLKVDAPGNGTTHGPTDPGPLYIEHLSGGAVAMVAGKYTGIHTVGYRANGFASEDIPQAPSLSIGTTFNNSGYSLAGQSVRIEPKTLYVIAVGDPEATSTPAKFTYQYLYVNDVPTAAGGTTFSVEFRLTKNEDQRN